MSHGARASSKPPATPQAPTEDEDGCLHAWLCHVGALRKWCRRPTLLGGCLGRLLTLTRLLKRLRVDSHTLRNVVGLVDADKPVSDFKHVVAQADDHELRVLGALLQNK